VELIYPVIAHLLLLLTNVDASHEQAVRIAGPLRKLWHKFVLTVVQPALSCIALSSDFSSLLRIDLLVWKMGGFSPVAAIQISSTSYSELKYIR
jgi:hypothetical protein